jgi:hypothetical protein
MVHFAGDVLEKREFALRDSLMQTLPNGELHYAAY